MCITGFLLVSLFPSPRQSSLPPSNHNISDIPFRPSFSLSCLSSLSPLYSFSHLTSFGSSCAMTLGYPQSPRCIPLPVPFVLEVTAGSMGGPLPSQRHEEQTASADDLERHPRGQRKCLRCRQASSLPDIATVARTSGSGTQRQNYMEVRSGQPYNVVSGPQSCRTPAPAPA